MSEEILKALMQLFALITKQDGGIGQKEIDYVNRFLIQQIGVDSAVAYLKLYKETAEDKPHEAPSESEGDSPVHLKRNSLRSSIR